MLSRQLKPGVLGTDQGWRYKLGGCPHREMGLKSIDLDEVI